jgi:hypothetical protein
MQRRPQEVAARITGEDATRPVAPVCRRRKAQDQDPRLRIAETRQRPRPVFLPGEPARRLRGRALPPLDQPRAAPAIDDLALDLRETR